MRFKDYVPGEDNEKFIPVPSYLLFMEPFSKLSPAAFKLYVYLQAMVKASYKHEEECHDGKYIKDGKICVYLSFENVQKICSVKSKASASKVKKELVEIGLIEDHRQGFRQSNYIFVKKPVELPDEFLIKNNKFRSSKNELHENNHESRSSKNELHTSSSSSKNELHKLRSSKNELHENNHESNDINRSSKNELHEKADESKRINRSSKNELNLYRLLDDIDDDDISKTTKQIFKKYLLTSSFITTTSTEDLKDRLKALGAIIKNSGLNSKGLEKKAAALASRSIDIDTISYWVQAINNLEADEVRRLNGDKKQPKRAYNKPIAKQPIEMPDWDNYHPNNENEVPEMSQEEINAVFRRYGKKNDS